VSREASIRAYCTGFLGVHAIVAAGNAGTCRPVMAAGRPAMTLPRTLAVRVHSVARVALKVTVYVPLPCEANDKSNTWNTRGGERSLCSSVFR